MNLSRSKLRSPRIPKSLEKTLLIPLTLGSLILMLILLCYLPLNSTSPLKQLQNNSEAHGYKLFPSKTIIKLAPPVYSHPENQSSEIILYDSKPHNLLDIINIFRLNANKKIYELMMSSSRSE